jgi:hypothetical protein
LGIIKVLILGVVMNVNLKEDVKPISYIKTNAAEMIVYIINLSEKAIREGKVYDNDQVFTELKRKIRQKRYRIAPDKENGFKRK